MTFLKNSINQGDDPSIINEISSSSENEAKQVTPLQAIIETECSENKTQVKVLKQSLIRSILEESDGSKMGPTQVIDDFSNASNFKNSSIKKQSIDFPLSKVSSFHFEPKTNEK